MQLSSIGRAAGERTIFRMHPAKAAILNTALEPLWQRLRQWVSEAMHNHEDSRDQLTHEELAPIRTAIFEIEALRRRLVLVAATAVTLDITARWSPPPKTDAKTRARQSTKRIVRAARGFRLFTIRWSKADKRLTTTVAIESNDTSAAPHTSPRAHSDTLTSGSSTCRSPKGAGRHGAFRANHRAPISKEPPEMTPEDYLRWHATRDLADAKAAFNAQYRQATQDPDTRPRRIPQNTAPPKLEKKSLPQLLSSEALQARLALLKELVANPEELIRRAAIAMARRREIAWRLSLIAAPKAVGHLAVSVAMAGTIIPFHYDFSEALLYFALSYTEPDTT